MINFENIQLNENVTRVDPSDNLFSELGKNTYDYKDVISELIDNSLAARIPNSLLSIRIDIITDGNGNPIEFYYSDNASGIPNELFGQAISPAAIRSNNSLNEHGLGMKQAIAALGKLKYLATKTASEHSARVIKELKFGNLSTYSAEFGSESGTEICVSQLNRIVISNPASISKTIRPYLGARYRRFLKPDNKTLDLMIRIKKIGQQDYDYTWQIDEVKPVYFHPSERTNRPVIMNFEIGGDRWKALLTFGYAPKDKDEYDELGINIPSRNDPYYVSLNKQGLDILLHDRVILFHQLSELGLVGNRHNDYNSVRGEIVLVSGFCTAITKNSIIHDDNFSECITTVGKILNGEEEGPGSRKKDYLTQKSFPEDLPEALLRDRLKTYLQDNPMKKREVVNTEYVVQGIEGFIDILADNEAWELKTEQASALDIYQLFMYMDVGNFQIGYLVAKSFSTGAEIAQKHIKDKHQISINLCRLSEFPINHPPSQDERTEYY